MQAPWQEFSVDTALRDALAKRLEAKEEIFSFRSEPQLSALLSCLGLQFELGKIDQDRTSSLLGIDLARYEANPWESQIISYQGQIGIRAWIPGLTEFSPRHPDFASILHPLSLVDGKLSQIVIFPTLVAAEYERRGIELVVVKSWAQTSFLSRERNLNYQKTNRYEIETNIALTQVALMEKQRLAFLGTHDLGDHLLGGKGEELRAYEPLLSELRSVYARVFPAGATHQKNALVISYLIAVMLDDLAQPQWYRSEAHIKTVVRALGCLQNLPPRDLNAVFLPPSFHRLVARIRDRSSRADDIQSGFNEFRRDLVFAADTLAS